ncbi:MAG TPA: oxygenase MpaB family protein, partial [Labilithrix sp.]
MPDVALRALGARLRDDDPRANSLRAALLEGDPLADDVVAWMDGRPERRAMLERAIARGVEKNAPAELAAFFDAIDRVPSWVDRKTIALATDTLCRCARSGTYALGGASLMSGYLSSGAVKPLVATGLLLTMARRRLSETGKFLRDVATSGTLDRFSDGIQSAIHVRVLHAVIRRRLLASGRWRVEEWGTPINQRDMVGTNLEFSIAYIGGLTALGCLLSRREREAMMHLWRFVGFVVGVREDLLPKTFAEGLELAWMFNGTEQGPDDDSRALAAALVEAWSPGLPGREHGAIGKIEGHFLTGYARFVLGRRAADALNLPNDAWKYAPLVVMPVRASFEALRRLVPGARARAVRRGRAA